MSGDLISRAALLGQYVLKDCVKYGNKTAEQQRKSYDTLMMYEIADMIEEAPTAYDLEEVIQRLNDITDSMLEVTKGGEYRRYVCFEDVLKIVKSGGIDGKKGDVI